jgi:integrase
MSGRTKRGGVWHIDKQIAGVRVLESTGTGDLAKAEEQLAGPMEKARQARLYGIREEQSFRAAATRYLTENQHKRSIHNDATHLKHLDPFVGNQVLKQVHMGSLQAFIEKRRADGVKTKSVNGGLATVRRILNLAATEWMDDRGMTWLETAPKIKLFPIKDARAPYPLSADEQAELFQELPAELEQMALFKVNTGCREPEVTGLRWDYEVKVSELETSVFLIPAERVKNGEARLVVLNRVARSVIESVRGMHLEYVFVCRKRRTLGPVARMNNTAWKSARDRAAERWQELKGEPASEGFRHVPVHDLKHTFGRRLRAAGVSFEDRQDLLGHRSGRITTHNSRAELANLRGAADRACGTDPHKSPQNTWLRRRNA